MLARHQEYIRNMAITNNAPNIHFHIIRVRNRWLYNRYICTFSSIYYPEVFLDLQNDFRSAINQLPVLVFDISVIG